MQLVDIPDYADVMTVEEFADAVRDGLFTNDDGTGYFATPLRMDRDCPARPSDIRAGKMHTGFTHVAWFNK